MAQSPYLSKELKDYITSNQVHLHSNIIKLTILFLDREQNK